MGWRDWDTEPAELPHVHKWRVCGYQNVEAEYRPYYNSPDSLEPSGTRMTQSAYTRLLRRCDGCEDYDVKMLAGTWSAVDLELDI